MIDNNSIINFSGDVQIINDKIYYKGNPIPELPKKSSSSNVTIINDKLYINGYEWKNNQWKRTLNAIWNYWF